MKWVEGTISLYIKNKKYFTSFRKELDNSKEKVGIYN